MIVAKWRLEHNIDGIDLDIEAGAGDQQVEIFIEYITTGG